MYQYSEKEKRLFEHFDCIHFIESESVDALFIYREMCVVAFLRGEDSLETDSLRLCMNEFIAVINKRVNTNIKRLTTEWDEMIEFSDV